MSYKTFIYTRSYHLTCEYIELRILNFMAEFPSTQEKVPITIVLNDIMCNGSLVNSPNLGIVESGEWVPSQ
jgi:hypothetical protein